MEKIKVLYIGGHGRSGSTILGDVLGSAVNTVHLGELSHILLHGFRNNSLCGCGKPFRSCEEWSRVIKNTKETVFRELGKVNKIANNKDVLFGRKVGGRTYINAIENLYLSIKDSFDSDIIIDSSKLPWYVAVLSQIESIDLYVLHLIRNPLGTCYSWKKRIKRDDADAQMKRMGVLSNSRRWISCNIALNKLCGMKLWPSAMVRYEDFARAPSEVVPGLLDSLTLDIEIPFADKSTVRLGASHAVWGNPNRLREGPTEIRRDDAWKKHLSFTDRCITYSLCGPLMLKYGYLGFSNK